MFPLPGSRGFTVGYGVIRARRIKLLDAGTAAVPAVELSTTGSGLYDEVSRVAMASATTDRAYWGATNHNYVGTTFATTASVSNLLTSTGHALAVAAKTVNYTVTTTDRILLCDPTSGGITVALPAAASAKQSVTVKKTVTHANTVIIDPNGAETIDGAATLTVADNTSVTIVSDGSNWHTISAS